MGSVKKCCHYVYSSLNTKKNANTVRHSVFGEVTRHGDSSILAKKIWSSGSGFGFRNEFLSECL